MKTRTRNLSLSLALLCGLSSIALGIPLSASAAAPPEPVPLLYNAKVGLDQFPPLPFSGASMDLPRIRYQRQTKLAAVNKRSILEAEPHYAVAYNGLTLLHMNVDRAPRPR